MDSRLRLCTLRKRHPWPIALLVIWQLTHVLNRVSDTKLPPPTEVVHEAYTLITTNSAAFGTLQHALLVSLGRMAMGFALGRS